MKTGGARPASTVELQPRARTSRDGRSPTRARTTAAMNTTDVTMRTTTNGHSPLSDGARSSATRKTEMKTPARIANTSIFRVTGCGASSCTRLTKQIASIPAAIPTQPQIGNRSPKATPARTGSTTAMSADIGDATLIGPIASAWKNTRYARAPPIPETTPQNQASADNVPLASGATTSSRTRPSG